MPKKKIEREEILLICWKTFHRLGYKQTSLQILSNEVGLGKAGLLHHFGNKEDLMREVLSYARKSYASYVLDVRKEDLPLEQRLEKMIRRELRLARIDQRGCFFANMILETGQQGMFSEELQAFYNDWMQATTELLAERFPAAEAEERAYRCFIDYEGSVMLYKLDGNEAHFTRFIQRTLAQLDVPLNLPTI